MNKYKLGISLVGLTFGYLATVDGITKPVWAQEAEIDKIQSLSNSFSTNATDLFSDYQLAQTVQDLEKFCTNYPYNSQCRDFSQPGTNQPRVQPKPSRVKESTSRQPATPKSSWAIVPEVSTLGLGGSVVRKIVPQLNAKAGINAFGLGFDLEETDATYDSDLNLFNVSTILDYHPSKRSGFRLSGGLIFSDNNAEGTTTPTLDNGTETITIGNQTFNVDELASADADVDITNSVAPYLGIGWGNPVAEGKGLGFWFNAGVAFGGSPEITVTPNITEGVSDQIRQEIEQAAEDEAEEIEDNIGFISVYPVVSLGLSYQF